jgi:hypothetical protein
MLQMLNNFKNAVISQYEDTQTEVYFNRGLSFFWNGMNHITKDRHSSLQRLTVIPVMVAFVGSYPVAASGTCLEKVTLAVYHVSLGVFAAICLRRTCTSHFKKAALNVAAGLVVLIAIPAMPLVGVWFGGKAAIQVIRQPKICYQLVAAEADTLVLIDVLKNRHVKFYESAYGACQKFLIARMCWKRCSRYIKQFSQTGNPVIRPLNPLAASTEVKNKLDKFDEEWTKNCRNLKANWAKYVEDLAKAKEGSYKSVQLTFVN